jgi:Putative phage serine protease XkdF
VTIDGGNVVKDAQPEAWDGTGIAARMIKSEPERRFTLHVAYPANKPDAGVAADGFRDFAGAQAVEDAAWSYMLKSRSVGLWHQQGTDGSGDVVESYVYRGPDWQLTAADESIQVIKAGDWLLGIQWTPDTWELIKSGRIRGVSMQGTATRRTPTPEALAALRKENSSTEGGD